MMGQPERRILPILPPVGILSDRNKTAMQLGSTLAQTGWPLDSLIREQGWEVKDQRLSADTGGLQAMLCQRLDGGFTILIDPDLTPNESVAGCNPSHVRMRRLAHEIAHTAFYLIGCPPWRVKPPDEVEEQFCDLVAESYMLQVGQPPQCTMASVGESRMGKKNADND